MFCPRSLSNQQHFITHLIVFVSHNEQKLCKNVRDLEHVDISYCVALSDPAVKAFSFYCRGLITLRMVGCLKVHAHTHTLLKPLNVILLKELFLLSFRAIISIFFHPASDDRYGSAVSNKWISVLARAWCEWLHSPHRSRASALGKNLSSAQLHHNGLLQWHLRVRHLLKRVLQSQSAAQNIYWTMSVFLQGGCLKTSAARGTLGAQRRRPSILVERQHPVTWAIWSQNPQNDPMMMHEKW